MEPFDTLIKEGWKIVGFGVTSTVLLAGSDIGMKLISLVSSMGVSFENQVIVLTLVFYLLKGILQKIEPVITPPATKAKGDYKFSVRKFLGL